MAPSPKPIHSLIIILLRLHPALSCKEPRRGAVIVADKDAAVPTESPMHLFNLTFPRFDT